MTSAKEKPSKARVQVMLDKGLKDQAEVLLDEMGLNPQTAINILYKQIVANKEFPIELKLNEEQISRISLVQLAKKLPVEVIDTDEKLNDFIDDYVGESNNEAG